MPNATAASGSRTSMAAVELLVRPGRKAALQPGAEGLGRLLGRISGLSPMRHDVGAPQRRRDGERHEHEHADDDESEIDIACTAEQQPRRDHEPDQQPRRGLMDRRMELIRHPVGRSGRPVHGGLGHRASLCVEIYLSRMSCCPTAQLPPQRDLIGFGRRNTTPAAIDRSACAPCAPSPECKVLRLVTRSG